MLHPIPLSPATRRPAGLAITAADTVDLTVYRPQFGKLECYNDDSCLIGTQ
jgi:hypothetical protein